MKEELNVKTKAVLNIDILEYEKENGEFKDFIIPANIDEISFTSNKIICTSSIFLLKRNKNLTINIKDLKLVTEKKITMDLRGGINEECKIDIVFLGDNLLKSRENIGVCISNNKTVEIKGDEDSKLNIESGTRVPAIGSNFYTAGTGNIIFSGDGKLIAVAGGEKKEEVVPWEGEKGSYAIGFYSDENGDKSSIEILDNINIKAIGEDGQGISSIKENNIAGEGGSAIETNNNFLFKKTGLGAVELLGGKGGNCEGKYKTGKCGKGGSAIKITEGEININYGTILKGGNGGSVKEELTLAAGGDGGDVIGILNNEGNKKVIIKIDYGIIAKSGNGGISGRKIYKQELLDRENASSGSIINSEGTEVVIKGIEKEYLSDKRFIVGEKVLKENYDFIEDNKKVFKGAKIKFSLDEEENKDMTGDNEVVNNCKIENKVKEDKNVQIEENLEIDSVESIEVQTKENSTEKIEAELEKNEIEEKTKIEESNKKNINEIEKLSEEDKLNELEKTKNSSSGVLNTMKKYLDLIHFKDKKN